MNKSCSEITIIYDISSPDLWDNKVFDFEVASVVDALNLYHLGKEIEKLGYKVMTADIFLKNGIFGGLNLMITECETKYTSLLLAHGCIPAICYCGESPLVIPSFYYKLRENAGRFRHSYLFKGAHSYLKNGLNINHVFYWTNIKNFINEDINWNNRKFLTLINSNKRSSKIVGIKKISDSIPWLKSIYHFLRNLKAFLFFPGNIPDLYNSRLNAILFFSRTKGFDLYGQGWDKSIVGISSKDESTIRSAYKGKLPRGNENKHLVLQNYKFAICFENTIFPGYITEKIFDCILCGTIPIYYGAPDIEDFIPEHVFIDFRKFSSLNELQKYLVSLSEFECGEYLKAAKEFINSPLYDNFYIKGWINQILTSLQTVIHENENLLNK